MRPKTCNEWQGKRVILNQELRTTGGAIFHAGETLIVRRAKKGGIFELYRPGAAVVGDLGDCFVVAEDQKALFVTDNVRGSPRREEG